MTEEPEVSRETSVAHYVENKPVKLSMFDMEPEAQIAYGVRIATCLRDIIREQKLTVNIGGKEYVKVEGWEICGTFLGLAPREREVSELGDGSFLAYVDLIRISNNSVYGGASALCGRDEKRWAKADRFAIRSMAITRAVGKAYRISCSWIMSMAGYEVTPAEEMPREEKVNAKPQTISSREEMAYESEAPGPGNKSVPKRRVDTLYSGSSQQQQDLEKYLTDKGIAKESWLAIHEKMIGRNKGDITKVLGEI